MKFQLKHLAKQKYGMKLHASLDPLPLEADPVERLHQAFCKDLTLLSNVGTADTYHPSYAYYLAKCWANHYGAVISAEMFWFTAMTTFARMVQTDAEAFRQYFVDFPDRKKIEFIGNSDETAVFQFIELALPLIKLNLMPNFSTATRLSKLATGVAFCDAISPYVYGMICSCGIPSVTVADQLSDWETLEQYAAQLANQLAATKAGPFFGKLSLRAHAIQDAIKSQDATLFQTMFDLANCASGSPVYEFSGWITELFGSRTTCMLKTAGENCAKAVFARDAGRTDLVFLCGIFASTYNAQDNVLTPHFDRIIAEK